MLCLFYRQKKTFETQPLEVHLAKPVLSKTSCTTTSTHVNWSIFLRDLIFGSFYCRFYRPVILLTLAILLVLNFCLPRLLEHHPRSPCRPFASFPRRSVSALFESWMLLICFILPIFLIITISITKIRS